MSETAIKIEGLREFQRNLRKLDNDLPKTLRIAMNQAADLVVQDAKPRVPKKTGKAQASIKVASTRTAVRVKAGGRRAPYYPWLDWGGAVGRKKSVRRPFIKDEGRYLYRSYFDLKASGEFQLALEKALLDVAAQAGVVID